MWDSGSGALRQSFPEVESGGSPHLLKSTACIAKNKVSWGMLQATASLSFIITFQAHNRYLFFF